jgi:paraquat-inducible protein B
MNELQPESKDRARTQCGDGDGAGDPGRVRRTVAAVRRNWWPGWIWAVPLAALAIGGWLAVRSFAQSGVHITIEFKTAQGLQANQSQVTFRGLDVGKVTKVTLMDDGRIKADVSVDASVEKYLNQGTEFWLEGAAPSLSDPASIITSITGDVVVMEPGTGKPARHFVGLDRRPALEGPHGPLADYSLAFSGAVGELKPGAPVTLRGFTVGEVERVGFSYDPQTDRLATPVTVALDPSRFHIAGAHVASKLDAQRALDPVLAKLVDDGLRAELTQNPPLVGSYQVTLRFVQGAGTTALDNGHTPPQIPTAGAGGVGSIVAQVNALPIRQIAQNVLAVTNRLRVLASSPKLTDSLNHLDSTLATLDRTTAKSGPQVTKLIQTLHQTADDLQQTVHEANRVLGGPTSQNNARVALKEMTEAARSVRSLANYLDRHPEALIKGRP